MSILTIKDLKISFSSGIDLLDICKRFPEIPIKLGCKQGECGTCKIKIIEGHQHFTKLTKLEQQMNLDSSTRLACQCGLNGDVTLD